MKTQNVKSFTDQLAQEMKQRLEILHQENLDDWTQSSKALDILTEVLQKLRQFIHTYNFKDTVEEIEFFKQIKPVFMSHYHYHREWLDIKTREPVGTGEDRLDFFHSELGKIQNFIRHHQEFHIYCRSGATYLDEYYFRRRQAPSDPQWDERFTSQYDNVVAKFLANELLKEHIMTKIRRLHNEEKQLLSWTGSKTALIELIYSLHSLDVFNNGQADLKQIASTFENLFDISLGNYYRVFQEIRLRKSGRTNFLDQLKEKLIQRMEAMDENG